jgi:RNA polymerase sigma factor (TIGR02999 family)
MEADATGTAAATAEPDKTSLDAMLPLVYEELRRIAAGYLAKERADHTLQPTALVNEAYLKLVTQRSVDWRKRAQFCGIAAQMMRRILINHAVARKTEKRGGNLERITLTNVGLFTDEPDLDVLALDEALAELAAIDAAKATLVELKFFGGMTMEEIAAHLGKPIRTLEREWAFARGWLYKSLLDRREAAALR